MLELIQKSDVADLDTVRHFYRALAGTEFCAWTDAYPGEPELHFNVSHSGGLALCGAGEAPLGVDVEVLRPRRPGLARYVCSEAESAWLERQGGDWGAFYTLWTLKEARVKCTGEGLRRPPRDIAVPLLRPGETGELDGLVFSAFSGEPWRAAACCPTPQGPLELFVRNS